MNLYESGADMEVPVSNMEDSTEAHYQIFPKTDPDGRPYTVSPSRNSWDEASRKTG